MRGQCRGEGFDEIVHGEANRRLSEPRVDRLLKGVQVRSKPVHAVTRLGLRHIQYVQFGYPAERDAVG